VGIVDANISTSSRYLKVTQHAAAIAAGRGQVTVNSGDRAAASMAVLANGSGAVQAFNYDGQPVSVLTSGDRGDGLM
jgi:hypothetical protein